MHSLTKTGKQKKIIVAEDHPLMRQAIRNIIDHTQDLVVVAEASDGEEAITLVNDFLPDLVVMDISLPKLNGLEATRRIKASHPGVAVLIFTVHGDDNHIIQLLKAGAAGYLLKDVNGEELIQAIRSVTAGDSVLGPSIAKRLMKHVISSGIEPLPQDEIEPLTAREVQILRLAALGRDNKGIAQLLDISTRTVKGHLTNIFSKLSVSSRTEAIFSALRTGLISLDDLG